MHKDQYLAELEKVFREKCEAIVEGSRKKTKEIGELFERYAQQDTFDLEEYKKESEKIDQKYQEKEEKVDIFYKSQVQALQAKHQRGRLKAKHGLDRESDCVFLAAMNIFDIMRERTKRKASTDDAKQVLSTFHEGGKEAVGEWLRQRTSEAMDESMQQLEMWHTLAKLIQEEYLRLKSAVDLLEAFSVPEEKKEDSVN